MKYKIGDRLRRNNIPWEKDNYYDTDPPIVIISDYANMKTLHLCNGYEIQDIVTGKKEDASYEYVELYYELDIVFQRNEKLKKLSNLFCKP